MAVEEKGLKWANDELQRKIGSLPIPTLALVEGENDTGKSVLVQQIAYSALLQGYNVRYITTENTTSSLISQMNSLSFNVNEFFAFGQFKVTELHTEGIKWSENISSTYLGILLGFLKLDTRTNIFLIDSLTYLVTHVKEEGVLEFFSLCRNIVDDSKKTLMITLHPYAFPQDLLVRIRSICDGHFILDIKTIGDRTARVLTVSKLRGASKVSGNIIAFEVDPAFGIKVVPFSQARA